MAAPYPMGVRLLPNAVTVIALCAGLSGVYFALRGQFELCVLAVAVAALCDALDGRLARLLDATTRIGAELDSLADLVSFGVSPALVLYIWQLQDWRYGWAVALVFAVCMALRLARFNTLLDDADEPAFTKEFFVGVPAPAAALVGGIPLYLYLHFGDGWWNHPLVVAGWAVFSAALMVSRLPTFSFKTAKVSPRWIAPLLVVVGLLAAVLVTAPFLTLGIGAALYLVTMPYAAYRHNWLSKHPEAWDVPGSERRAVVRAHRSAARRLGLRQPLRRRVAGRASEVAGRARGAVDRAVRRLGEEGPPPRAVDKSARPGPGPHPARGRLRPGLRRERDR